MCPAAIRMTLGTRGGDDRANPSCDSVAPMDDESATPEMETGSSPKNHRGRWLTTRLGTNTIQYARPPNGRRRPGWLAIRVSARTRGGDHPASPSCDSVAPMDGQSVPAASVPHRAVGDEPAGGLYRNHIARRLDQEDDAKPLHQVHAMRIGRRVRPQSCVLRALSTNHITRSCAR